MSDSSDINGSGRKAGINNSCIEIIKSYMGREPNNTELMIISELWHEKPEIEYCREKLANLIDSENSVSKEKYRSCTGAIRFNKEVDCITNFISSDSKYDYPVNCGIATIKGGINNIIASGARPVSNVCSYILSPSKADYTIAEINEFSTNAGIPVINNSLCFDTEITGDPLLNIMTLGIAERKKAAAQLKANTGDSVMLLGHFSSGSQLKGSLYSYIKGRYLKDENPPAVIYSILEKLLIEGVLELLHSGVISGVYNIDRSGIAGAAADIMIRNSAGIRLDIDKFPAGSSDDDIPKILSGYLPYSFLAIINNKNNELFDNILEKWLLDHCQVGEIIKENDLKCYLNNKPVVDIPGKCVRIKESTDRNINSKSSNDDFNMPDISADEINEPEQYKEVAIKLLKQPDIAAKIYAANQSGLLTGSVDMNMNFPAGGGVFKPGNFSGYLTAAINTNPRYVSADNKTGIIIMIAQTIRDIICTGSDPLGMSLCLNICESADIYFKEQFELIYDGIEEAIKHFGIPLANFNINSGFKEKIEKNGNDLAILPVIGTTGKLNNSKSYTTKAFIEKGHMIYLIGKSRNDIASSEYLRVIHKIEKSPAPFIDIEFENNLHKAVTGLIKNHLIISAHSISEGGLFFTLLESAVIRGYGFDITSPAEIRLDAFLFGEAQGRIIATVSPARETEFIDFMLQQDFPFSALGHITKEELRIDDISYGFVGEYKDLYNSVIKKIPSLMKK